MKKPFTAVILFALLLLAAAAAWAEAGEITYRDYSGTITVPADTEYVDLGAMKVENYDAFDAFLDQLPNVKQVDMYTTHMFRKQANRLSERYPQIEFGWTLYFGDHTVRTDQTAFSTLHDGYEKRHTSQDFEILRHCRRMQALDLGHNDLTDISFIAQMPELRLLILADNEIEDISPLAGLQKLEYVELFRNRISDLTPLAGLDRIMDLHLTQNRAMSLAPLMGLPNLQRLWLRDACSSKNENLDAEVAALRAAFPGAQIETEYLGSDGGWRDHPHYDVLSAMFRGTQYAPFADSFTDSEAR